MSGKVRKISPRGKVALNVDWWPEALPEDTTTTSVTLVTFDGDITRGTLYRRAPSKTVVALMHPRLDVTKAPQVPTLLKGGYAVWTQAGRDVNNDLRLVHENTLLDVAAGVEYLREQGFEKIVLLGISGGAALYTYYTEQSWLSPDRRIAIDPAGRPTSLVEASLPGADGLALMAPHPGQGKLLLSLIDPSVTDETDPLSCDPSLDPYNPANGFGLAPEGSHYPAEFITRYRAAQRQRVQRIDDRARQILQSQKEGKRRWDTEKDIAGLRQSVATPILTTYRTDADLRCTDLSLDPSERAYGSLNGGSRPHIGNYGLAGFGRLTNPEAWLSTWSGLSSYASIERAAHNVTLPTLVVEFTGDTSVFPADVVALMEALNSTDKTHLKVRGDHFGKALAEGEKPGRTLALEHLINWLNERFPAV